MLNLLEQQIREYYYSINENDLYMPDYSKFKHFRFLLCDGRWEKIKKRIRTKKQLKEFLIAYAPLRVFVSAAYFLNPTIVGKSKPKTCHGYDPNRKPKRCGNNEFEYINPNKARCSQCGEIIKHDNARILFTDLPFDIDEPSLPKAKRETKKLYSFLAEKGFKPKEIEIRFSGTSFHVIIKMFDKGVTIDEDEMKQLRDDLVGEAIEYGCSFDVPVSRDIRRITGLPSTIHSSGNLLQKIRTKESISLSQYNPTKIIKNIKVEKPTYLYKEIQ